MVLPPDNDNVPPNCHYIPPLITQIKPEQKLFLRTLPYVPLQQGAILQNIL